MAWGSIPSPNQKKILIPTRCIHTSSLWDGATRERCCDLLCSSEPFGREKTAASFKRLFYANQSFNKLYKAQKPSECLGLYVEKVSLRKQPKLEWSILKRSNRGTDPQGEDQVKARGGGGPLPAEERSPEPQEEPALPTP